jgi:hypothetical protein
MKRLILCLSLSLLGIYSIAQNGLENIIVEKYYISNAADAAGSSGVLPAGSVTYRIYADMLPGYKFQMAYGTSNHNLKFTTSTSFFNNTSYGSTTPNYSKSNAAKNTVMLDSWLSVGAACTNNFGILKTEDNSANNVVNINGLLQNNVSEMGIPLTTQDGLITGTPKSVTFVGMDLGQTDYGAANVLGDGTANGNSFILTGSAWTTLSSGATGPIPASNRVLIAQITTNGVFHYELNIQIGTPTSGIEVYVASNPLTPNINGVNEFSIPSLTGTLNGPPTPYAVTGSGSYCQNSGGLPVGLANSELGVTYTINPGGTTVFGNGSAISFGNKLAGTYTISGTNSKGTTAMTGSALIIENLQVTPSFTALGPYTLVDTPDLLLGTSLDGINGIWNPATINTSVAGTSIYTFTPTSGQCADTTTMIINVNSATKTLSMKLFIEGLYAGIGIMNQSLNESGPQYNYGIADQITVELHNSTIPFELENAFNNVNLNTDGSIIIDNIPGNISGAYYIVIKHRNSLETWSSIPINFNIQSMITYDFSTSASQSFGDNMKETGGINTIWGGDVTQDGVVDGSDMAAADNASSSLLKGYNPEDVNGDGIVDGSDMAMIDNNSSAIVQVIKPQ